MSLNKISLKEKIGFGLGDGANLIVLSTVFSFLTYYYSDVVGISMAAIGTMFLVVRIVDAVTDPLMGYICDRTVNKHGHYRPWLVRMAIPYGIMIVLAFSVPTNASDFTTIMYAGITYALLMIVYTAINIPYCALGTAITSDQNEQLSIQSIRFVMCSVGALMVSTMLVPMVNWLGADDEARGFQLGMTVLAVIAVIMFFICFKTTKERVIIKEEKMPFKEGLMALLKNDQWRIIGSINFLFLVSNVARGSVFIFYAIHIMERPDLVPLLLTLPIFAEMLGSMMAKPLGDRFCKVKLYIGFQFLQAVSCLAIFFIDPSWITIVVIFVVFRAFIAQMSNPVLWTMLADVVDYGEWKTGKRLPGMTSSGNLFGIKMGMAIGGAGAAWVLSAFGYVSGGESQTEQALMGVMIVLAIVPALIHLLMAFVMKFYKLDKTYVEQIKSELNQKQNNNNTANEEVLEPTLAQS
ncbi:glycoside-pentoside-hexuronide (GPH):cation symporter [Photobacterium lutimaris]|uniref:MFS transporter n=1 Tax=Photobacterium lutimaris TaxID=388278 RepID=A0A2T3IY80_9GAMM|nr:MFS transporter [Photobacterium lutimaris]PSU33529.1 MFS transporter [Photobacterium lutimaris]TDR74636.1 GPH family glycoside/pentoside/hexuronide:cation symporter [Photobacterium lutimaris]